MKNIEYLLAGYFGTSVQNHRRIESFVKFMDAFEGDWFLLGQAMNEQEIATLDDAYNLILWGHFVGVAFTERYIGYSVREAKRMFKTLMREKYPYWGG